MNSLSNDSLKNFGDKEWTEKKLIAFEKYVKAYLKIMHSQRRIKRWLSKIIYFDGFAGSGINSYNCGKSLNENENQLSFLNEEEGIDVYNGAAERVVKMPEKFDHYFFVDINEKAIETLEEKLNIYNTNKNFTFLCEDVNNAVDKLIQELDRNSAALVLFDPFGMQLKWRSIEKFKNRRVDLWILIPSGVIINRLLKQNGDILNPKKMEEYYGLSEDELKKHFYSVEQQPNLFEDEKINIKYGSAEKCADLYIERLKNIWKFVTEKPLVLYNSKNVPIYHFVFASNNETAKNIASYIINQRD